MVFHPLHCVISSKVINEVADDIIDIAKIASDRRRIRNNMIAERLQESNQHTFLTPHEINEMTRSFSKAYVRPEAVSSSLKKISKELNKQYKQLCNIFEELR